MLKKKEKRTRIKRLAAKTKVAVLRKEGKTKLWKKI